MHLFDNLVNSIQSILAHKLRSLLTLLGITIGVAAVITMFSSIYGIKQLIRSNMEGMGWNNSIIVNAKDSSATVDVSAGQQKTMYLRRQIRPLTLDDYNVLSNLPGVKYHYGHIERWLQLTLDNRSRQNKENNNSYVRITATNLDFFRAKTYGIAQGRFFNAFEEKNAANVCVVGPLFVERYFGHKDMLNQFISVGGTRYQVIGVLQSDQLNKNGMQFNPWERQWDLRAVYIPLSTGCQYFTSAHQMDFIYLQAENDKVYPQLRQAVYHNLLALHGMSHDFDFQDVGAMMFKINKEIEDRMNTWNMTLSAIASISLLVGGIGLFSTLLISINEKMVEIGIRKGVGATDRDIFLYFLTESVTLALISAVTGILISLTLIKVVTMQLHFNFPFPTLGIVLGFGFSLIIGFASGFYPAWKASRVDPIQAIFYFE